MYRLLLRAFPRQFRQDFGGEMTAVFNDMRREARRAGSVATMRFYWAATIGALRHGWAERRALRAQGRDPFFRGLLQDTRFAARLFSKRPGFVTSTVLTLSLGIGLTVTAFAAVHGVLVEWLRIPDPAQVVRVAEVVNDTPQPMGAPSFAAYRDGTRDLFTAMAGFRTVDETLVGAGDAARVPVAHVTPEFFQVLGQPPVMGRALDAGDTPESAVMISRRFWQAKLGNDPQVLAHSLDLDGQRLPIVGIVPDSAIYPASVDLWRAVRVSPEDAQNRNMKMFTVIGRMRDGVTTAVASAALNGIAARLNKDDRMYAGYTAAAVNLREDTIGRTRRDLLFVQAVAAIVLLIGCANVANLMLVSASARRHELGIRAALGAGTRRLVRQLLAESALLGLMGGAGGLLLATWLLPLTLRLYPGQLPGAERVGIDAVEWLAAIGASLCTTLIFGLAPALLASRTDVTSALRDGPRSGTGRSAHMFRWALVSIEVVLTLTLLSGASLLARSYARLTLQSTGFDARGIVTAQISLPPVEYPSPASRAALFTGLIERIKMQPGVRSAAAAYPLPFQGMDTAVAMTRVGADADHALMVASMQAVSSEYFDTLGIPLRRGRFFTAADTADGVGVMIVNEQFAQKYSGAGDVLNMAVDVNGRSARVVGIVADTRFNFYQPAKATVFFPMTQTGMTSMRLMVKTSAGLDRATPMLRDLVRSADPRLPVLVPATLESIVSQSVAQRRFNMTLLGLLSICAVVLAAIGLYGVMAFVIGQREREMSIRMALGSTRGGIQALLLRQALTVVMLGVAGGLAGGWYLTGLLKRELFQILPHDPRPMAAAAISFVIVGALASWLPSRRVTRIDPVSVLKGD